MLTIHRWDSVGPARRRLILRRPGAGSRERLEAATRGIVERVRSEGDAALRDLTRRLDGVDLAAFQVAESELRRAVDACEPALRDSIARARDNVASFHRAQLRQCTRVETAPGLACERILRPIPAVGLYVPAGSAPLVSTAIMLAVPAALAGCPRRVLCTPPTASARAHPIILAAARLCDVDEVYCLGGAQAIAALAYGTETVPRVAKIFGPGNAWVEAAKALVARDPEAADCDMVAGPSELVVIADRSADPELVAADLLAQCEHADDAQVLLITDSAELATAVARQVAAQLAALPRAAIARRSLAHSATILVELLQTAFGIADLYAPEHLALHLVAPRAWLDRIHNAGAVFLGGWTPVALGDYCSGANHVLPTGGLARARGGLGVDDFQKALTVQEATPNGLRALGDVASRLAAAEALEGHRRSVLLRLERLGEDAA